MISTAALPAEPAKGAEPQPPAGKKHARQTRLVGEAHFDAEHHFYPRVLNAAIHPLVASFFALGNRRIHARYVHLNPQVDAAALEALLATSSPAFFKWAGSDLFNVTTAAGQRQMIVIETNSCPSGQKSMPPLSDNTDDGGGYRLVVENAFLDCLRAADPALGGLAVVYDKNEMEASGYAAMMADVMHESVWYVPYYDENSTTKDSFVRWDDGVMSIRDKDNVWHSIRACFRYVTQKPWNRFPIKTKTVVLNNILACLAGGRNKMMADRAYEFLNAEMESTGLAIRTPETMRNVPKTAIPLWIDTMGGHGVVKVPYSNAGQGVYTITNKDELDEFMALDHHYDKFIVQSLVGNSTWSSVHQKTGKRFFHVGTIPNKRHDIFVCDIRMMIVASPEGFKPVAIYARRARKPLSVKLDEGAAVTSWEMLGTNLSVKTNYDDWTTETQRLLLMDRKDFNQLGIGVDDLIDAYIQTVLSVVAIDKMAARLVKKDDLTGESVFDYDLFAALNPDPTLLDEIKLE